MDLAQFREYCLSKPCATESTPFGPDVLVFKVGGKMFALAALDEVPTTVNLKCDPDLALENLNPPLSGKPLPRYFPLVNQSRDRLVDGQQDYVISHFW